MNPKKELLWSLWVPAVVGVLASEARLSSVFASQTLSAAFVELVAVAET